MYKQHIITLKCLASLAIREMKIKNTMWYPYTPTKIAKIILNTKQCKVFRGTRSLMEDSRNLKVVQPLGKTVWQFLVKTKCIITMHACSIASVVSDSLQGLQPARLLCPWVSPGKNTGVDCHALFRGSSRPGDWTQVSHVSCAGRWVLYHYTDLKPVITWIWPNCLCSRKVFPNPKLGKPLGHSGMT